MAVHELKIEPNYFDAVSNGIKTFEVRYNDRNYQVGDFLLLREYKINNHDYTGRNITVRVDYILEGKKYGLYKDHVVMSIKIIGLN